MANEDSVIGAFSEAHASRLTGVSIGQLRGWARIGLIRPSYAREDSSAPFSRIYSFKDLVSLRVLNQLRNVYRVKLQELREVAEKLSTLGDDRWTKETLYVLKGRVVWKVPGSDNVYKEIAGEQIVAEVVLKVEVEDTRKAIIEMNRRGEDQVGKIVRSKYVSRNAYVFAGTRIPVKVVGEFLDAGYNKDQILKEYPTLAGPDIDAAIAFRKSAAA